MHREKDMKRCNKCGVEKPLDCFLPKRNQCRKCGNEVGKHWKARNAERVNRAARMRRKINVERERALNRERYWRDANKSRGIGRKKYWQNVERRRESLRKSIAKNAVKHRARASAWAKKNTERIAAKNGKRRTKMRNAGGSFTAAEWRCLKELYGNRCLCCGKSGIKLEADHVVPVALGGSSCIDNVQPLCSKCNKTKGIKTTDYRPVEAVVKKV
jgi:5-methylcytosine-specific restriction endonuclease McrA